MPSKKQSSPEWKNARTQMSREHDNAISRSRQLFDGWVRYVSVSNAGAIVVAFGLAGAYADKGVSPVWFVLPVLVFSLGLGCAGAGLFMELARQDERANLSAKLNWELGQQTATPDSAGASWGNLRERQGVRAEVWEWLVRWIPACTHIANLVWTWPRTLAFIGAAMFCVGVLFGLLILTFIEPTASGTG